MRSRSVLRNDHLLAPVDAAETALSRRSLLRTLERKRPPQRAICGSRGDSAGDPQATPSQMKRRNPRDPAAVATQFHPAKAETPHGVRGFKSLRLRTKSLVDMGFPIWARMPEGGLRTCVHSPPSSVGWGLSVPPSCGMAVRVSAARSVDAREARRRLGVAAGVLRDRRIGAQRAGPCRRPVGRDRGVRRIHRSRRGRERCPARPMRSARRAPGAGPSPGRPRRAPCPEPRSTGRISSALPL